jgi:hypothetical protein
MSIYVSLAQDPATGDIALQSGRAGLQLVTAGDKIVQNIKQRLKFFLGEWFLDLSKGVPYLRDFLGRRGTSTSVFRSVIREHIAATAGVVQVLTVEAQLDRVTRKLTIAWRAQIAEPTSEGLTTVSGSTSFLTDELGRVLTDGGDTLTA